METALVLYTYILSIEYVFQLLGLLLNHSKPWQRDQDYCRGKNYFFQAYFDIFAQTW